MVRPNVLMFGDWGWDGTRTSAQETRMQTWLRGLPEGAKVAIIEMGAGKAVPTVRHFSERLAQRRGLIARLIRINPRESDFPDSLTGTHYSLPFGAFATLKQLDALMEEYKAKKETAELKA